MSHPPRRRSATLPLAVQAAKAIGHPARLRVLAMLRPGPLCVCQMTAALELAPSTVSAHLLELRRGGLVTERKRGRWVEYHLRGGGPFTRLMREALALVEHDPATAADRDAIRRISAVPVEVFCRSGAAPGATPTRRRQRRRTSPAMSHRR